MTTITARGERATARYCRENGAEYVYTTGGRLLHKWPGERGWSLVKANMTREQWDTFTERIEAEEAATISCAWGT